MIKEKEDCCGQGEKAGPRGHRSGSPHHLCLESALSAGLLVENGARAFISFFGVR